MQFLDIRNVETINTLTEGSPDGQLSVFLRRKGVFPDQSKMLIGDLVLVSPHSPAPHQKAIQQFQLKNYDIDHAQWTHAAVYVGEGWVCEATIKGVRVSRLEDSFEQYSVRFRRTKYDDENCRFKIAIGALRRVTSPYGWKEIMKMLIGKSGMGIRDLNKSAYICSGLYCEAHFFATESFPVRKDIYPVSPADLSQSNKLIDIDLEWLRIPKK